jgi:hypothetical protein
LRAATRARRKAATRDARPRTGLYAGENSGAFGRRQKGLPVVDEVGAQGDVEAGGVFDNLGLHSANRLYPRERQ